MQWSNWHLNLLDLPKRWQSELQRVWQKMLAPWRKMSDLWQRMSPQPRPRLSGPSARPREAPSGRYRHRSSRPGRATTQRLRLQWRHQVTVFVVTALSLDSTTNSSPSRLANVLSCDLKSTSNRHHKDVTLELNNWWRKAWRFGYFSHSLTSMNIQWWLFLKRFDYHMSDIICLKEHSKPYHLLKNTL